MLKRLRFLIVVNGQTCLEFIGTILLKNLIVFTYVNCFFFLFKISIDYWLLVMIDNLSDIEAPGRGPNFSIVFLYLY